ncbi:hypothetical protein [Lentzea sp. HUAS12]|nr:hypothetical protein [Lentzea sp. HUAS12]
MIDPRLRATASPASGLSTADTTIRGTGVLIRAIVASRLVK